MKCPVDDTVLVMSDRQGIEIDYCPQCRGVWLDRGELDKIIDRSEVPQSEPSHYKQDSRDSYKESDSRSAHYDSDDYQHKKKHKKEGFLGDLFDF